jgi:hypothetical protein
MDYALKIKKLGRLRWACRAIVIGQTLVSVWANSLQAQSNYTSIAISILPPAFVMAGFELVSRIPIHRDGSWLIKVTRPVATASITLGSAWLSYFHQRSAFGKYTDDITTVRVLPLLIDGLMVVAAVSLIELNAQVTILETKQAGLDVRVERAPRTPATKVVAKAPSGKERIALVLAEAPELAIKEIAAKAGVSYNYAHSIVKELRPPQAIGS